MKSEIKIGLPFYKMAYGLVFMVILSLIRGVTYSYEVGMAMDTYAPILVFAFCADTYTQEIISGRSEIQRLYPIKKRMGSVVKRLASQAVFLIFLEILGYGLFFLFQRPLTHPAAGSEGAQFFIYALAAVVTALFWGVLSNTLSIFFRNMWVGIGGCLFMWVMTNSTGGERLLGFWNPFSYVFRNWDNSGDFSWIQGKALCVILAVIMLAVLPGLLRKRG